MVPELLWRCQANFFLQREMGLSSPSESRAVLLLLLLSLCSSVNFTVLEPSWHSGFWGEMCAWRKRGGTIHLLRNILRNIQFLYLAMRNIWRACRVKLLVVTPLVVGLWDNSGCQVVCKGQISWPLTQYKYKISNQYRITLASVGLSFPVLS